MPTNEDLSVSDVDDLRLLCVGAVIEDGDGHLTFRVAMTNEEASGDWVCECGGRCSCADIFDTLTPPLRVKSMPMVDVVNETVLLLTDRWMQEEYETWEHDRLALLTRTPWVKEEIGKWLLSQVDPVWLIAQQREEERDGVGQEG